jgi:hypothetical protein
MQNNKFELLCLFHLNLHNLYGYHKFYYLFGTHTQDNTLVLKPKPNNKGQLIEVRLHHKFGSLILKSKSPQNNKIYLPTFQVNCAMLIH